MRRITSDHDSIESMLHQDHYRPEELAELLNMTVDHVRGAIHNRRLRAIMVDHQIVSIRRADVVRWLEARAAAPERRA